MDRKKVIYIGMILILTVIVSITYFSYAFFTHTSEQKGVLNVVVGKLDYKLESADLNTNNSIVLAAGEKRKFNIKVTSLNNTNSKYELYYQTDNNDIEIGYSNDTSDTPAGVISANNYKVITIIIKNKTDNSATISFGVQGGFSGNTLTLNQGNSIIEEITWCVYTVNQEFAFNYNGTTGNGSNGSIQTFEPECDGRYKLEVYGAEGGYNSNEGRGGDGGYSYGETILTEDDTLYIAVGGYPYANKAGGYNGGGTGAGTANASEKGVRLGSAGGGATHIALNNNLGLLSNYSGSVNDLLIVAGGGGGGMAQYYSYGGDGGGTNGAAGVAYANDNNGALATGGGGGATQTAGGAGGKYGSTTAGKAGSFGTGGNASTASGGAHSGAGGGGYYGGGSGAAGAYNSNYNLKSGGGGGSGYLNTTKLIEGTTGMESGRRTGHGYALITYLGD